MKEIQMEQTDQNNKKDALILQRKQVYIHV